MNGNDVLTRNIDKIHTTEMGIDRIKRNLGLADFDVVEYCKALIAYRTCRAYQRGKNWYCEIGNVRLTIHSHSYTIITAHMIK